MPANPIVKTLDVLKDGLSSLLPGLEGGAFDTLAFERAEETFHRRVVGAITRSTHTGHNP
jgi:hypothetical protein